MSGTQGILGSDNLANAHSTGGRGWTERSDGAPRVSLVPRSNPGHPELPA